MTGDDQAGFGGGGMERLDRGSFFIGNTIANLRGLDPTFGSRTLTLIDGRRVNSTSNQADVVDLNIIPSNLLERMDVVTGGASATYGSGAMAGVVNLVLNRRLNGVNLDMDYGINEAGDGAQPPRVAVRRYGLVRRQGSRAAGPGVAEPVGHPQLRRGARLVRRVARHVEQLHVSASCQRRRRLRRWQLRPNGDGVLDDMTTATNSRPGSRWPMCAAASSRPPARSTSTTPT